MKQLAQVFKALGDEGRLEIVAMLMGREMCVCDILNAFNRSQPTVSHHLKILKQAGILVDNREGKWIYYSINPEVIDSVKAFLQEVSEKSVTKERYHTCSDTVQEKRKDDEE